MDLDVLKNKIIEKVNFYEQAYEIKFWNLSDDDLLIFLTINYQNTYNLVSNSEFEIITMNYFDLLINEMLGNNKLVIDKKFITDNLYLINLIENDKVNEYIKNKNQIKEVLYEIFHLQSKVLIKK